MCRSSSIISFFAVVGCVAVAFTLGACNRGSEEIKVYRLAKAPLESPSDDDQTSGPAMGGMGPMQSTNAPVPSGFAQPSSTAAPPNWEPQTLSQMRQASFLVHGENGAVADISFVTLGPAAGNVLENVNRWLGQLAQPPVTAEKLASTTQKLSTPGGDVDIVDITGKPENGDPNKDGRIVAGIAVDQDKTAFYKMRGNAALVEKEKVHFLKWVISLRDNGSRKATPDMAAPLVADTGKPDIKWDVPSGWSPAPPSAMRYASFAAKGGNAGQVDISVVTFPGDGGGDLENINRWRQQIGLGGVDAPAASSFTTSIKNATAPFSAVDFAGANSRLVAAWARHDGRTWFIKMTGPTAAVEEQKPNFQKFIESVRF
jgi:hypothetical protein